MPTLATFDAGSVVLADATHSDCLFDGEELHDELAVVTQVTSQRGYQTGVFCIPHAVTVEQALNDEQSGPQQVGSLTYTRGAKSLAPCLVCGRHDSGRSRVLLLQDNGTLWLHVSCIEEFRGALEQIYQHLGSVVADDS